MVVEVCTSTGKTCHPSKDRAMDHVRSLRMAGNRRDIDAFKCRHCDCWHIGHRHGHELFTKITRRRRRRN